MKRPDRVSAGEGAGIRGNRARLISYIRINKALQRLIQLEKGWDGYSAEFINPSIVMDINEAIKEFPQLLDVEWQIVPLVDGGVQLEIHSESSVLEFEFLQNGNVEYLYAPGNDSSKWEEGTIDNSALYVLPEWVEKFKKGE